MILRKMGMNLLHEQAEILAKANQNENLAGDNTMCKRSKKILFV